MDGVSHTTEQLGCHMDEVKWAGLKLVYMYVILTVVTVRRAEIAITWESGRG